MEVFFCYCLIRKNIIKIRRLLQSAKSNLPFNVVFHPEAANEHTSLQAQRRCIQSSRDHAGGKADGSRHPSDRHGQVDDSLQARGAVSAQALSMAITR